MGTIKVQFSSILMMQNTEFLIEELVEIFLNFTSCKFTPTLSAELFT